MRPACLWLMTAFVACDPPDEGETDPPVEVVPRSRSQIEVVSGGSATDGVRTVVVHIGTPGPVGQGRDGRYTITLGPVPPR
jgi:hypothetical protein